MNRTKEITTIKLNRLTIIKCIIVAILILLGAKISYLNIVALLLGIWFILSGTITNMISILLFLLSFSPIFKLHPGGNTFFNILIIFSIHKFLLLNSNIKFSFYEILSLLAFLSFGFAFGGVSAALRLINITMYLLFILLLFKQNEKLSLHNMIFFFSLGIILSSTAGLCIDYIPGLSSFIQRESKLLLDSGRLINRFSGITSSPNAYSTNISVALSIWAVLMMSSRTRFLDYIFVVLLSLFGFMTLSKSFMLSYGIIVFTSILNSKKIRVASVIKGLFFLGLILLSFYMFIDIEVIISALKRWTIEGSYGGSLSSGRIDIWRSYFGYIFNDFRLILFGIGIGSEVHYGISPHNYFIEIFYYLGIVGSILYLVQLKNMFPQKKNRLNNLLKYLPLIIFITLSQTNNFIFSDNIYFFFILIYLSINEKIEGLDNYHSASIVG